MKTLSFAALLTAAFVLISCSPNEEVSYENPPIGILMSQNHQITIHTGPDGPLYSVKGPDGQQLATEISKEELQASFPNLDVGEMWADTSLGTVREGTVPASDDGKFIPLEHWIETTPVKKEEAY